jgi:hypothetical protein
MPTLNQAGVTKQDKPYVMAACRYGCMLEGVYQLDETCLL